MKTRLIALFCICALALGGCANPNAPDGSGSSSAPPTQGEQQEVEESTPPPFTLGAYYSYSFHPVLSTSQANLTLAPLLYQPLFTVDEHFQAQPLLCQSYTVSEDGLTWTFTLKGGITFSDGTPLDGAVAAKALQMALGEGSRYAGRLTDVSSIRGREMEVTVTLTRPNGELPLLLDIPISLGEGDRPLGTGPYVLAEEGRDLVLLRRQDGWQSGDQLPFDRIPLASIGKAHDLSTAFNSGEITLMDGDLTGSSALGYSGSYQVFDYSTTDFLFLGFQTQQGLCRSVEVRRTIAQAIDRDRLVESALAGHAVAASLPVHPNSSLYHPQLAQGLAYQSEALITLAQQLDGKPLNLLVNIEDTAKSAVANWIAQQLESAGLVVAVDRLPWEEYLSALERGDFDLYLGEVYLTADFDLSALVSPTGGLNYGRWMDASVGGLLSAVEEAQGEERALAAQQLYLHLNQWAPIAPLCFKNGSVLTQYGRVSGVAPTQGNVFSHLSDWTVE